MKIQSITFSKEECRIICPRGIMKTTAYLLKDPLDLQELGEVRDFFQIMFSSRKNSLSLNNINKKLTAIDELHRRATLAELNNWRHWGYEQGRDETLKALEGAKELLGKAKSLLEDFSAVS